MIYTKTNFAVVEAASKDECRPALCGICLEKDGSTVATDGHVLFHVGSSDIDPEDFPCLEKDKANKVGKPDGQILPTEVVKSIVKSLVKRSTIPILENAILLESDNGNVQLGTTDITNSLTHSSIPIGGPYPNWRQVIPQKDEKPILRVAFRVEVLEKLIKFHKKTGANSHSAIRLSFFDNNKGWAQKAIGFEIRSFDVGQTIDGIVMPVKEMDD